MNISEFFSDHLAYSVIVVLSLITGLCYYIISCKNKPDFKNNIAVFCVSGALSIVFSLFVCRTVSSLIFSQKYGYSTVFSIFYAFASFPVFAFILQKVSDRKFDFNTAVKPVILAIVLARIACITDGCCDGTIYAVKIECAVLLLLFVYDIVRNNLGYETFCLIYSLWRFSADFFKLAYKYEKLGPLTLVQYVALIVALVSSFVIIYKRRSKNEK